MLNLLLIIGVIFAVLWMLGLITSFTFGGGIHILLVVAAIVILIWLLQRRR